MRPRDTFGANPPGRLAAVMLRALTAELSDPGRYGRARAYARDGAVVDIEIEPGVVRGVVQGTRPEAYQAMVFVSPLDADEVSGMAMPGSTALRIPGRDDLAASCTCPDGDEHASAICKHALATLMVLADEITIEPDLLLRWRSGEPVVRRPTRSSTPRDPHTSPGAAAIDVLADRLRSPAPLPDLPALSPPTGTVVRADEFTDVLVSALAVLTRPS